MILLSEVGYMRLTIEENEKAVLTVEFCGVVLRKVSTSLSLGIGFPAMVRLFNEYSSHYVTSLPNNKLAINLLRKIIPSDGELHGSLRFIEKDLIVDITSKVQEVPVGKNKLTGTIVTSDIKKILDKVHRS